MPSVGGTLLLYLWSRYAWLAGAITIFMPFCTACVAVIVPLADPDAGFQYSATEGAVRLVPVPAMSAQPMTVLPWPWTMPASVLMNEVYWVWLSSDVGTSSPPTS